eukprot:TRINITY_DN11335_c0_g1_i6.p1 TRINITY_DN11335_c0_g1~~TRINITY_DN11335_c0_g1_i6.p1  ORF type:complete len:895 (+),score=168.16 TRINITY_DN11335_c0_g1_i6:67-2751(+)
MPSGLTSVVLGGAGLGQLWRYNRENYMFDVPLQQNREFQLQNIQLTRYGLFREDIRDLTAQTVDKLDGLLTVNTLKLGFIVTVFFNFDRNNDGNPDRHFELKQLTMTFTMCLLTAFFLLSASIWYAIQAIIVTQTLMTKTLLQVVRLPLPTASDIGTASTSAAVFERDFSKAFRVPFLQARRPTRRHFTKSRPAPVKQERVPSDDSALLGNRQESNGRSTSSGGPGGPITSSGAASATENGNVRREPEPLCVNVEELIQGGIALDEKQLLSSIEPHIKLFKLVKQSWTAYDLYGKITMEIGNVCLMTGLAFFALCYLRTNGSGLDVEPGGWATFGVLTVVAWWMLVNELDVTVFQTFVIAVFMCGSSVLFVLEHCEIISDPADAIEVVLMFQAVWVLAILWSAVSIGESWPSIWLYTRFLNPLFLEGGPGHYTKDVYSHGGKLSASEDESESESETSQDGLQRPMAAYIAAGPLLQCLDILRNESFPEMKKSISVVRDRLYQAAMDAGAMQTAKRHGVCLEPFWVVDKGVARWMDPDGMPKEEDVTEVSLGEMLEWSDEAAATLIKDAQVWTSRDMEELSSYGGEPICGIPSFMAQFQKNGSLAKEHLGKKAKTSYLIACILLTVSWLAAVCWAVLYQPQSEVQAKAAEKASTRLLESFGRQMDFELPFPWLASTSLGCDSEGDRLVLADGAGVFLTNVTGSNWTGPLNPCGDDSVTAADFGPRGELWALCAGKLQQVPLESGGTSRVVTGKRNLEAVAVDAVRYLSTKSASHLDGLALQGRQVLGLHADAEHGWRFTGTIRTPSNRKWVALAFRSGRGLALDEAGAVFECDMTTGSWTGPMQLPESMTWLGLCALPRGWLALGQAKADGPDGTEGAPQLWHFESTTHEQVREL